MAFVSDPQNLYDHNDISDLSDHSGDAVVDDDEDDDDEEEIVIDEKHVPRFLYDRSLLLPFLPCFIFLLSLTGKWYLVLIALMALFVYLLDLAEEKQKSVTVAIVCIFISQCYVIYAVSPLVWQCFMNVFLVLLTNIYTVLTGGWILLQFSHFIRVEYNFARALELVLFTVYPVVCCGMMTWWLASLTHVQLAPYYFTFIGFILLQLFLSPAPSSFGQDYKKSSVRSDPILEPEMVATLVTAYVVAPGLIYVATTLYWDYEGFLDLNTLGTLVFIGMAALFLATHLNIKTFTEHFVIDQSVLVWTRWLSGIGCLLTMGVIIRTLELSSRLLPWLPFAAALHVTLGCALSYKKTQKFSLPSALVVLLFYTSSLYLLPASTTVHGLSMPPVYAAICVVIVLVLASIVLMSNPLYVVLANTCLVSALIVFTILEVVLYCADLYNIVLCLVTCAICAYVAPRLHHVDKSTPIGCQLILTLAFSKLIVIFQYKYLPLVGGMSWLLAVCTTTPLVWLVVRFVFFTRAQTMPDRQKLLYVVGQGTVLFLSAPTLLNTCYKSVMNEYASNGQLLVLYLFAFGSLCLKLTMSRQCPLLYRNHAPALMIASIVALVGQPRLDPDLSSLLDVWFVVAVLVLVHTLCGSFPVKRLGSLATMALVIGVPIGNKATELIHGSEESVAMRCVCVSSYVCVVFTIFMLRYTEHNLVTPRLVNTSLIQVTLWTVVLLLELQRTRPSLLLSSRVTWSVLVACLVPAVACKTYAASGKTLVLHSNPAEEASPFFPLVANIYTIGGFILACLVCPIPQWDLWCCLCSSILLLLHHDDYLMTSLYRRAPLTTPAVTGALFFVMTSTLVHNVLWSSDVTIKWTIFLVCQGLLELLSMLLTLPIVYQLFGVLWQNQLWVNERAVVFLTPLFALHLYGASYQSWATGLLGLLYSGWMICYKFPLVPDKMAFHRERINRQRYYRR